MKNLKALLYVAAFGAVLWFPSQSDAKIGDRIKARRAARNDKTVQAPITNTICQAPASNTTCRLDVSGTCTVCGNPAINPSPTTGRVSSTGPVTREDLARVGGSYYTRVDDDRNIAATEVPAPPMPAPQEALAVDEALANVEQKKAEWEAAKQDLEAAIEAEKRAVDRQRKHIQQQIDQLAEKLTSLEQDDE